MLEGKYLYELISSVAYMNICNDVLATRKVADDGEGEVTYAEVKYTVGGKTYTVQGTHFPLGKVFSYATENCKYCHSKGYETISISKKKLPDPTGYYVVEEDTFPKDRDPSIVYASLDTWKIITPCDCAVKNVLKEHPELFTIDTKSVYVGLTYQVEDEVKSEVQA